MNTFALRSSRLAVTASAGFLRVKGVQLSAAALALSLLLSLALLSLAARV